MEPFIITYDSITYHYVEARGCWVFADSAGWIPGDAPTFELAVDTARAYLREHG